MVFLDAKIKEKKVQINSDLSFRSEGEIPKRSTMRSEDSSSPALSPINMDSE